MLIDDKHKFRLKRFIYSKSIKSAKQVNVDIVKMLN